MRQKQPASTFVEYIHIINYTFRLYKRACASTKVGVAVKLLKKTFSFECTANE